MDINQYAEPTPDPVFNTEDEKLSYNIIGAAIEVHRQLGPGLLESVYEHCLAFEFTEKKLNFKRQVPLKLKYKTLLLDHACRLDFLVENTIVLELKAVDKVLPVHEAQLLTYLKLSKVRIGLLINFNEFSLRKGVTRLVL